MQQRKTDNKSLNDKLAIRRMICGQVKGPLRVLDLFCGTGRIWSSMRRHFPIETYTPVDKDCRQPGTLRMNITPRTVRAFNPAEFNVIDIDTYGEPWEIWSALATNGIAPGTAVFFTFGHACAGRISYWLRAASGIPTDWPIPMDPVFGTYLGRRHFLASMARLDARQAVYIDLPNESYYGALLG